MYFSTSSESLIVFKIRLVSTTFLPVHKQKYGICSGTNFWITSILSSSIIFLSFNIVPSKSEAISLIFCFSANKWLLIKSATAFFLFLYSTEAFAFSVSSFPMEPKSFTTKAVLKSLPLSPIAAVWFSGMSSFSAMNLIASPFEQFKGLNSKNKLFV